VLDHLIAGEELTAEGTAELLHGRIRENLDEVMRAIEGTVTGLQKQLLRQVIDHIDDMTRRIGDMDEIIKGHVQKFEDAILAVDAIPGIGRKSAESIIAEIGIDMSRFPSAANLASWAGLCPGNNESAGKRRSGKTTKGNSMLRITLIECAKAAKRVKHSFFYAQFNRISVQRGKNRAVVAVAHSMLIAIYHVLKNNTPYVDLGSDYYERFNREKKANYYIKKLRALGVDTTALATS
jgi:transposase